MQLTILIVIHILYMQQYSNIDMTLFISFFYPTMKHISLRMIIILYCVLSLAIVSYFRVSKH